MSEAAAPDWVVQTQFQYLEPFLVGEPRQFLVYQGEVVCLRADPRDPDRKLPAEVDPCQGCPHFGHGCEIAGDRDVEATYRNPDNSISGLQPHSRRGVGLEERSFLVLRFLPGKSHADMPASLWDNPYADRAMYEANLHHALTNPRLAKFHTIKGQVRFYGPENEFLASPYAEFLEVVDEYEPSHRPVSLDFSAIEPRVSSFVSREPEWVQVFKGTPKVISRRVEFAAPPAKAPRYVHRTPAGETYCYLDDEMDKLEFSSQCAACPLNNICTTKLDHYKNVAGDWHGINAEGLYGSEFTSNADKHFKKALRSIAKIVGLALTYGGSAWTVAGNMQSSKDKAQERIDSFFAKLVVLARYMTQARTDVVETGWVRNLFSRMRYMGAWVHSQALDPHGHPDYRKRRQHRAFAERTALNYPIQSAASELLKIAMIRVEDMIARLGWNPLSGMAIPQTVKLGRKAYRSLRFALLSSVHDELLYLALDGQMETVIPLVYEVMQLPDVMEQLDTGFSLELDCEYDETRSWTASKKFQTARIYLLNKLRADLEKPRPPAPNLAVFRWEEWTPAMLAEVHAFGLEINSADAEECRLAVSAGTTLYLYDARQFPRSFIDRLAEKSSATARYGFL